MVVCSTKPFFFHYSFFDSGDDDKGRYFIMYSLCHLGTYVLLISYAFLYVMHYTDICYAHISNAFEFPNQKIVLILKTFNDVHNK